MSDGTGRLWNALHSFATPVAIAYYGDLGLLDDLVDEIVSLADPRWRIERATTVDEALDQPADALVLLIPADEVAVLEDLESLRDAFRHRDVPVVVLLLREGDGARALARLPSLVGWVRGNDVDPERDSEIDEEDERTRFEEATGVTPEAWLAAHAGASDPVTYRALLLVGDSDVG